MFWFKEFIDHRDPHLLFYAWRVDPITPLSLSGALTISPAQLRNGIHVYIFSGLFDLLPLPLLADPRSCLARRVLSRAVNRDVRWFGAAS